MVRPSMEFPEPVIGIAIEAKSESIKSVYVSNGYESDEVIEASNEHNMALYFTTVRHFLH